MSRLLVPVLISLATAILAFQSDTAIAEYRDTAQRVIDAALKDDTGMKRLEYLCTRIGNRLSGSAALERAIKWAANEMQQEGLENVRILPVKVPHWVRGHESAMLLSPASRPLSMLGLGDSIGTPADGIEADVAVVRSFADLDRLASDGVKGG
jgi:carboxypeptidase Q